MATILIVEDELTIASTLKDLFEMEGYHVVLAGNGREALDYLSGGRTDVILTDIMMPIMDGKALCQAIQQHPEFRRIPVVVMSAAARPRREDFGYAAFVAKPFNLDTVLEAIEGVLARAGLPSEE